MKTSYTTRLVLASLLVIASCFLFYQVLTFCNNRYFKAFERTQELFQGEINYDILFLGSSRMKNHANPKIVDSILQASSFNGGQNACTVIESNLILKNYLSSHTAPKLLVLGLDIFSLNTKTKKVGFYPTYLPYMGDREVDKLLASQGVNTGLLKTFTFLRTIEYDDYYKSSILKAALKQKELNNGDFYYKGFESNSNEVITESALQSPKPYQMEIDQAAIESLMELVQICERNQIKLFFLYAPEYKSMNWKTVVNADSIFTIYNNISKRSAIPFFRDDSLSICNDSSLFRNPGHLNTRGAEIYSRLLANRLKPFLQKNSNNTHKIL